jgi:hypothetical protein
MIWLQDVFDNGGSKFIFIPPTAVRLMKAREEFSWLRHQGKRIAGDLEVLRENKGRQQIIYRMYHLSNYREKYYAKLKKQIEQVKNIVISERN